MTAVTRHGDGSGRGKDMQTETLIGKERKKTSRLFLEHSMQTLFLNSPTANEMRRRALLRKIIVETVLGARLVSGCCHKNLFFRSLFIYLHRFT